MPLLFSEATLRRNFAAFPQRSATSIGVFSALGHRQFRAPSTPAKCGIFRRRTARKHGKLSGMHIDFKFNSDDFKKKIERAMREKVLERMNAAVSGVRCDEHPNEGRVTAEYESDDRILVKGTKCCPAFEQKVEAALQEAGVRKP